METWHWILCTGTLVQPSQLAQLLSAISCRS